MKLHLCCGDVYLEGYHNVDICGKVGKPKETATLSEYYKGKTTATPQGEILVDEVADLLDTWKWKDVDAILMISAFEHFTVGEGKHILSEAHKVLKKGGVFGFDFPDIIGTIHRYRFNPATASRFIYGSCKNPYSVHKACYTEQSILTELLGKWSTVSFGNIVKHSYPMIGVTASK